MLAKLRALRSELAMVSAAGRNPFGVTFDSILSATEAILDGKRVLLLGTNNYLGLTFDQDCIDSAVTATMAHGTGTTGSRIANGTYGGHAALEQRLARFLGRRHAMVFTTGYQANLGTLSALAGRGDHLLLDADSHASIYDGAKLGNAQVTRFRHNDPDDLRRRLRLLADQPGEKLIVLEGIYSMLGDTAPLREMVEVKREASAWLLVDEAHSLGVLGAHGRGLAEADGVEADVDFVVGTFSKSLGAIGGFCAFDLDDFGALRVAARAYMFTASLPPSIVASVIQAIEAMEAQPQLRDSLRRNGQHLHAGLAAAGFVLGAMPSPIVSLPMPDRETAIRFWNQLLDAGVYTNLALGPATPGGRPLLRMSVSAALTPEQIDTAIAVITRTGQLLGLATAGLAAAE
ncbi:pyridoxal phosphate-dependent aminotransferase family protein [Siccirubricoccus sp. KC 17139]|uniref:Pyridoxal phosphate-dependent aminotransferase family protein n=1 Tax=Siccirubricoccus soli TaxID=2899147 RepID=A0ABT1D4W1_9PROT|nr:pyridoxal phosphate-dependent aminotransferase family protein [Siccirubricoccus soli]MCO6416025.1 pyridoxal phosphate-dependent aminotransferase family protein [Siccirubricoccus soli]MCP2682157.1 pyridoxal phosphate-dependent aminotransferase family protein [Siccirubricoccus soli]